MKIANQTFKLKKKKNLLKKNKLFFYYYCINANSQNWIFTVQALKKLNLNHYKISNKSGKQVFKSSTLKVAGNTIDSTLLQSEPKNQTDLVFKQTVISKLSVFLLTLTLVKINNNIYSINQIKITKTFNYKENKFALYQLCLSNIKKHFKLVPQKSV